MSNAALESVMSGADASFATRWELPSLLRAEPKLPTAQELEVIQAAAYEEGFARGQAEGHTAGYTAGVAHAHEQARRLRDLVEHLAQPLADVDSEVERTLIALTIELARRMVGQQLQLDPTLTAAAVREALDALGTPREARVLLNPEDAEMVKDLIAAPGETPPWRIVHDSSLRRGDCRVLTDSGQVDALLDTRQASLARVLLGDGE